MQEEVVQELEKMNLSLGEARKQISKIMSLSRQLGWQGRPKQGLYYVPSIVRLLGPRSEFEFLLVGCQVEEAVS